MYSCLVVFSFFLNTYNDALIPKILKRTANFQNSIPFFGTNLLRPENPVQQAAASLRSPAMYYSLRDANQYVMNPQMVTPKIRKVFPRSNFVRQYRPKMVLGPIHHRNPGYWNRDGDIYKKRSKNDFVQASGKSFKSLCKQIMLIINELKDCFDEEVTRDYNDNYLARLLCLDGCAILQYIYIATTQNVFDDFVPDILFVENQIPYKVLKKLMELGDRRVPWENSIANFIRKHANPQRAVQIDGDHVHLLDLLRKSLLGRSRAGTRNRDLVSPSSRNVQQLKAAGIDLRQGSVWFLRNIVFSRRFPLLGRLDLPPITVDNSTKRKFLNLVAYEMSFENDGGVISYLYFLDSLINEAQDVKELRDAKVLDSRIGSDTELKNLLSEIRAELVSDPEAYIGVKKNIQEYYGTLMSKMLQLYHAYIRDSNWPLIIILAQLLGLFLSGIQAWFTVNPASQSHS